MPFANTYHICIWLFPLWWFVLVVKQLPNVSSTSTLLGHWLLACFPKSCGCRTTWEVIWKYLHWQMASTQPGIQTTSLWKRAQWPATASQKIQDCPVGCDRRSWIRFQLFGDTCYLTGIALLALLGGAENFIPCAFGKRYKENCLGRQRFKIFTNEESLASPWSDHDPAGSWRLLWKSFLLWKRHNVDWKRWKRIFRLLGLC